MHDVDLRRRHNHVAVPPRRLHLSSRVRRGGVSGGAKGGGAMHGRGRSSHLLVGAAAVPDGTRGDGRCRRGAAAAGSVERRWVNLRRPMPTVRAAWGEGGLFCSRRLPPRGSNDPGAVVRDEVQASAASRGRGGGSRQKLPPSSASRPPFQEQRSNPESSFQAPCGAMGAGQGSARANHRARGWGGCPAPLQSMARTSPTKGLCAPIFTAAAAIK